MVDLRGGLSCGVWPTTKFIYLGVQSRSIKDYTTTRPATTRDWSREVSDLSLNIEYLDIDLPRISLSFVNLRLFVIPPLPSILECAFGAHTLQL